jgi:hypothetical protein
VGMVNDTVLSGMDKDIVIEFSIAHLFLDSKEIFPVDPLND